MKAEYINPFIESAKSMIQTLCGVDAKIGSLYLKKSPYLVDQVIILIGVVGKIKGQVYFDMSKETAKEIASIMMGGVPIDELDEMSRSAISELGNMIMGNSAILFEKNNVGIDITPPSLLMGNKIEISNHFPTISVPLSLEGIGEMIINITAEVVN